MDWSNERFVRLYTRDTPEWLCWCWQARALWPLLIRKADRSGVLANKLGARGLAALVGLPVEVVEAGLPDLVSDGCIAPHQLGFVIPNYIEAQEAPLSDRQRQRESRERRRVVTKRDTASQNVTECHEASRGVTPIRSDLIRSDPKDSLPRAIPPSTEPSAVPAAVPATESDRPDVETRRQAIRAIMAELGATRSRVAAELGVIAQPLLAFDPGERDLGDRLALASSADEHASVCTSARHVIAMAALEARRDRTVEWLHGVIFSERNWRRLAGMTAADASRPRAGPRGSAARAEQKTIRPTTTDDDTPPIPSWSKT